MDKLMRKRMILNELDLVKRNSVFHSDNLSAKDPVKKIAEPVIGELIQQFAVLVESNEDELLKVLEARARANDTQALMVVLDNLWTSTGKYPDEKERSNIFFGYAGKTTAELDDIIEGEYNACGRKLKASDAAMAGRGINTGVGLTDSNAAVPKYGVLFSKYYGGDRDLAKSMLLVQFGARLISLYRDEGKTYPLFKPEFDPENSYLRKIGSRLVELIKMRERDFAAQEKDPGALPEFPIRGGIKEEDCRLAVHALKVAFEGDTFKDKDKDVHYKGLTEIFTAKYSSPEYTDKERAAVLQSLEEIRKNITTIYKRHCPEAVAALARSACVPSGG